MNANESADQRTVAEILRDQPSAAMAFIRMRTACVGCALARFCTLDDVSTAYGIPTTALRRAIAQAVATERPSDNETVPDDVGSDRQEMTK